MKTTLSFLLASLVIGPVCFASIPAHVELKTDSLQDAQELLTLPEKNRNLLAQSKTETLTPALLEISKSEKFSMPMRWKALTLAAYLKKEKVLPEINEALKSPDWFMRNAGLVALQSFDSQKAKEAAKILLKDKALVVRSAAVESLGADLDSKTRDLLWEELNADYNFRQKQSLWIRDQMLSALAQNPEKRELPLFVKALKDSSQKVQLPAMAALEKITQKKLGENKQSWQQKRQLWIQWAKANPADAMLIE